MKTQNQNKMTLKKLTIASINTQKLQVIKGGSSVVGTDSDICGTARFPGGPCVHIP